MRKLRFSEAVSGQFRRASHHGPSLPQGATADAVYRGIASADGAMRKRVNCPFGSMFWGRASASRPPPAAR
ncbi:hypothetical protein LP416_13095 [Polaromonas sp. P2-4]|nr:hypothetical protein LP416_13095 [Polaromonas sp. P2-4]